MNWIDVAYAMGAAGEGGAQPQGGFMAFAPIIIMVAIFYFLLIRPQQKKQKEHREMLNALKKGDTVVTSGGLQGKIMGTTETTLTLEIADKVRVKVQRGYIAALLARAEGQVEE